MSLQSQMEQLKQQLAALEQWREDHKQWFEEIAKYEESCRVVWDNYAVLKSAYDEGVAEGEALGRKKVDIECARKMKEYGLSVAEIIYVTGLTAEEVAKL